MKLSKFFFCNFVEPHLKGKTNKVRYKVIKMGDIELKPVTKLIYTIDNSVEEFDKSEKYRNLAVNLQEFKINVENCYEQVKVIENFSIEYDFDNETPASGYRSFVDIFTSAIKKSLNLCQRMSKGRMKILFRADYYAKYQSPLVITAGPN